MNMAVRLPDLERFRGLIYHQIRHRKHSRNSLCGAEGGTILQRENPGWYNERPARLPACRELPRAIRFHGQGNRIVVWNKSPKSKVTTFRLYVWMCNLATSQMDRSLHKGSSHMGAFI